MQHRRMNSSSRTNSGKRSAIHLLMLFTFLFVSGALRGEIVTGTLEVKYSMISYTEGEPISNEDGTSTLWCSLDQETDAELTIEIWVDTVSGEISISDDFDTLEGTIDPETGDFSVVYQKGPNYIDGFTGHYETDRYVMEGTLDLPGLRSIDAVYSDSIIQSWSLGGSTVECTKIFSVSGNSNRILFQWADGSPAAGARFKINGVEKTTDGKGTITPGDIPLERDGNEPNDYILLGDSGTIQLPPIDIDDVLTSLGGVYHTGINLTEVYLDFGTVPLLWDPTCRKIPFIGTILTDDAFKSGSMPGIQMPAGYPEQLRDAVQAKFHNAGVNVEVKLGSSPGGTTSVYFPASKPACLLDTSAGTPAVDGIADDIDKYNLQPEGQAIIFLEQGSSVQSGAQTVAHEIGHTFGLRHIVKRDQDGEDDLFDPINTQSVMDNFACSNPGCQDQFHNGPVSIREEDRGNHNPTYHLRRYVNGETDENLKAQVIYPGTYDMQTSERIERFLRFVTFTGDSANVEQSDGARRNLSLKEAVPFELATVVYNFTIAQENGRYGYNIIAHLDSVVLDELDRSGFELPTNDRIIIFASSTPDGPADIIMSNGMPNASSVVFGEDNFQAAQSMSLHKVDDSGTVLQTLAAFTPVIDTVEVPEVQVSLSGNGEAVVLKFPAEVGLQYQVQRLNSSLEWEDIGEPHSPDDYSPGFEWTDPTIQSPQDLESIKALYRVTVRPNN